MERYFYLRDVANEDADDDASASVMVPVRNITGIGPGSSRTQLDMWFRHGKNETHQAQARFTVTKGKLKQVTEEIVSAMNAGGDGVTVIYDAATTTHHADSIEGDNVEKPTRSLSRDITGLAITIG